MSSDRREADRLTNEVDGLQCDVMKPWGLRVLSNIPSIHQSRRNWMTQFYFFCSVLVLLYECI